MTLTMCAFKCVALEVCYYYHHPHKQPCNNLTYLPFASNLTCVFVFGTCSRRLPVPDVSDLVEVVRVLRSFVALEVLLTGVTFQSRCGGVREAPEHVELLLPFLCLQTEFVSELLVLTVCACEFCLHMF